MAEVLDYAIIGGGVSGVYCGWRLKKKDRKTSVHIFEAWDHIGGRLLSVRPPKIDNMVAELGGMRILPAVQPRIANLIKELNAGAPKEEKIETYPFPVDEPQNIAYLRGVHLRLAEFQTRPKKVPYRLNFIEEGQTPGAIIIGAIAQIVPGITQPNLTEEQRREMTRKAWFDGRPLYQQGFWNVLLRVLSCEAYHLGLDAGGYNSTLLNWNAADAIPWYLSDFGVDPQYRGFSNGFQQVPLTLAKRFGDLGGKISLNTPILGFEWDAKKKIFAVRLREDNKVYYAKNLILAMPRRSLELITPESPLLQTPHITPLIRSVTPRPLFKLFTTYTSPWWLAAGATIGSKTLPLNQGRSVTDMPVRQTYYWVDSDGKPIETGRAMLLASYDDGNNVGYWDGYRKRRGTWWSRPEVKADPEPELFVGEVDEEAVAGVGPEDWQQYRAPKRMVTEVARQLGIVHGLSFTPRVVDAAFRDWGDDPFGGGWNSWNIGVKSWEVIRQITKPYDDPKSANIPLYICGEAYSDAQGWVEGALQTADLVLARLKATK